MVFGFVALVLVAANLGTRHLTWGLLALTLAGGAAAVLGILGLGGLFGTVFPGPTSSPAARHGPIAAAGYGLWILGAGAAIACLFRGVRERVGRMLTGIDPVSPVHAVSLAFYAMLFTYLVGTQLTTDQLKEIAAGGQSPSVVYIIATNQLPFVVIAFCGVGLLARRGWGSSLDRLGLFWPGWRWIAASIGVSVLLVGFGIFFDDLMNTLTPDQAQSIRTVSDQLLRNVSGVWASLALALAAGVGEELVFRGALLPRVGNLPSALLFGALHTQYALSLATLEIVVLGLVLGVLRKRAGTTGTIVAHAGYDALLLVGIPFLVGFLH